MREIELERLKPTGEEELQAFYQSNLGEWERFHVLWSWRKKAPAGEGRETAMIARMGGTVVGSVGIVGVRVSLGGRGIRAIWQQDSLVSSEARGCGIGKALVERAADGVDLVLAKGTSEAMYHLRKKAGFIDVPRSNCMVRILHPWRRQGEAKHWIQGLALWCIGGLLDRRYPSSPRRLQELSLFGESFDALVEKMPSDQVLRPVKSAAYLNWRYFGCPGRQYRVIGDPALPAAVVVSLSSRSPGEGWIVDLISDRRATEANRALLAAGVKYLAAKGAERVWVFATLPEARRWLRRLGFLTVPITPRFTFRPAQTLQMPNPLTADFWHGDGDTELYG